MPGVKVVAVVAAAAVGAVAGVGSLLAALFEVQGFGTPRDTGPRAGRLALFALVIAAAVAGPLALWRILLPGNAPASAMLAVIVVFVLVVALLGFSMAGSPG